MPRTDSFVNPLVPLSLLEAVREADRPEGLAEAEYVPELLNKRLGTTDTVFTQIRRYSDAVRRGQPVAYDEVAALARLIGRRPDALEVFRAAGVSTARATYGRLSGIKRGLIRALPGWASRPLARRQARRILSRYCGVVARRSGPSLVLEPTRRAPLSAPGPEVADAYYGAALHELLALLSLPSP